VFVVKVALEVFLIVEVLAALEEVAADPVLEMRFPDVLSHLNERFRLEEADSADAALDSFASLPLVFRVARHLVGEFHFQSSRVELPRVLVLQGFAGEGDVADGAHQTLHVLPRPPQLTANNLDCF